MSHGQPSRARRPVLGPRRGGPGRGPPEPRGHPREQLVPKMIVDEVLSDTYFLAVDEWLLPKATYTLFHFLDE